MADQNTTPPPQWAKLAIDFGPLIVFFASFKLGDIWLATGTFMAASVVAMIASKMLFKKISPLIKFTFVVVMVMGGLTLYLQDETFVKMKLTILNSIFAAILLFGLLRGQLYIKIVMELAFEMDDAAWRILTRNYVIFLVVMAVINEVIWRTQSTDFWVNFKTFGYMGATIIFMMTQMPMLMKYMPDEDKG